MTRLSAEGDAGVSRSRAWSGAWRTACVSCQSWDSMVLEGVHDSERSLRLWLEGASEEGERGGKQRQGGSRAVKAYGLRGTSKAGWIGFGNKGIRVSGWEKWNVKDGPWFLTWVTRWVCAKLPLCDPMHCNALGSSVHGFSRQEYWSELPYPRPGGLPASGTEPVPFTSPALAGRFFTTGATWEAPP